VMNGRTGSGRLDLSYINWEQLRQQIHILAGLRIQQHKRTQVNGVISLLRSLQNEGVAQGIDRTQVYGW
jgi:predicted hydrolase (HD superfamily)